MAIGNHQSARSRTDEWLTPPELLTALGGSAAFDLDPCSPIKRPWDTARQHFTIEDNGLLKRWHGRVWLNPPYSRDVIGKWLGRMVNHDNGIALIFARTETATFHRTVWQASDAVLFLAGRLTFYDVDGNIAVGKKGGLGNAGAPSVLCAYGPDNADILAECEIDGKFIPLRLRSLTFGFADEGTWTDAVVRAMREIGNTGHLQDLYRALAGSAKARRNRHYKAKIRQTLQFGPFEPKGNGHWSLAEGRLI